MKKIWLGVASIATIVAPIAGVISCGSTEVPGSSIGIITSYYVKADNKTITSLTINLTKFNDNDLEKLSAEIDLIKHAALTSTTNLKIIISNNENLAQKIKSTAPNDKRIDAKFTPLISLLKIKTPVPVKTTTTTTKTSTTTGS